MDDKENFYYKLRNYIKNGSNKIIKNDSLPDYLLLAPDIFYLLIKLIRDPAIPKDKKIKLGFVIAYFITPFDLLPEALVGLTGYIDDLALSAYLLDNIFNEIDYEIVKKHWPGDEKILNVIQNILQNSGKFINKNILDKIKAFIDK